MHVPSGAHESRSAIWMWKSQKVTVTVKRPRWSSYNYKTRSSHLEISSPLIAICQKLSSTYTVNISKVKPARTMYLKRGKCTQVVNTLTGSYTVCWQLVRWFSFQTGALEEWGCSTVRSRDVLEVCNSRICWHKIAFYISNCSVFYPEQDWCISLYLNIFCAILV